MKEPELLKDIRFLLDQLNLIEWAQDNARIKQVKEKWFPEDEGYYPGRASRDNMSSVGDLDYDT